MSQIVVIQIKSPPPKISGTLQRVFLELAPGCFAGKIPKPALLDLWEQIQKSNCTAFCVLGAKTEMGFEVWSTGQGQRKTVDNYGVPLMLYEKKAKITRN
jgi:CRISPR-associated endoribonuclease Cas2 subtype I-E